MAPPQPHELQGAAAADAAAAAARRPPLLVGLYRDVWDTAGNAVGWEVVGWGVVFPDLSAVTVPAVGEKVSASVWISLEHALTALDVAVCEVKPRPYPQWWRDR